MVPIVFGFRMDHLMGFMIKEEDGAESLIGCVYSHLSVDIIWRDAGTASFNTIEMLRTVKGKSGGGTTSQTFVCRIPLQL